MEVNIPVAETTVTLLFEKLGGLGGSPKLLNLRGIRELTQKNPKSDPRWNIYSWYGSTIGFPTQLITRSSSGSIGWSESCHFKVLTFSQDGNILSVEIVLYVPMIDQIL